jgi:molybdenum cofactor cytidylyltransferase
MTAERQPRLAGLILAAGRSRRMGVLKQTLPWPGAGTAAQTTLVAAAFDVIASHVDRMFVAVGTDEAAVLTALGPRVFTTVRVASNAEMYESIRAGLRASTATGEASAVACDGVLLQPGDHPTVARETVEQLLRSFVEDPRRAYMPAYRGAGGHPVVVPRSLISEILEYPGRGGLRQIWIDHPDWHKRIAVDDPWCVLDVDTPEAYSRGWVMHAGPMT